MSERRVGAQAHNLVCGSGSGAERRRLRVTQLDQPHRLKEAEVRDAARLVLRRRYIGEQRLDYWRICSPCLGAHRNSSPESFAETVSLVCELMLENMENTTSSTLPNRYTSETVPNCLSRTLSVM